jgi:RNA polymerase-binding transcription factor DksA
MKKELDEKLTRAFPLLYANRRGDKRSTAMYWGFACGDGWFDIIWNLSEKLEPIIKNLIKENPNLSCESCGCEKRRHHGSATASPGKCLAIHKDPFSEDEPPGNYWACFCDSYRSSHPKAAQVKEKFGGLRFYMTSENDEIRKLISEAEALSYETCEECGKPGEERDTRWIRTLCDHCHNNWEEIKKKKWEAAKKEGQEGPKKK